MSRIARLAAAAALVTAVAAPLTAAHASCIEWIPGPCIAPLATCNLTDVTRPICGG